MDISKYKIFFTLEGLIRSNVQGTVLFIVRGIVLISNGIKTHYSYPDLVEFMPRIDSYTVNLFGVVRKGRISF